MPKKLSTNPKAEAARNKKDETKQKASADQQRHAEEREWAQAGEGSKGKGALKKEAEVRRPLCCDALPVPRVRVGACLPQRVLCVLGGPHAPAPAAAYQVLRVLCSARCAQCSAAQEKKRQELAAKKAEAKRLLEAEEAFLASAGKKKTPAKAAAPKARALASRSRPGRLLLPPVLLCAVCRGTHSSALRGASRPTSAPWRAPESSRLRQPAACRPQAAAVPSASWQGPVRCGARG